MSGPVGIEWQLFARQAIVPFVRRLARRKVVRAFSIFRSDSRYILRDRLWPDEVLLFGDRLSEVRHHRGSLILQADLVRSVRPFIAAVERHGLVSKLAFAQFCDEQNLPHPRTIGLRPGAGVEQLAGLGNEIFVKPDRGSSARGAVLLRKLEDDRWKSVSETGVVEGSLDKIIRPTRPMVAQPLLLNHRDLAPAAGTSIATFRIVTGHRSLDGFEALSILAELPLDDAEPIAARWANAPVNIVTGRIESSFGCGENEPPWTEMAEARPWHGTVVPHAMAMVALAQKAHCRLVETSPEPLPSLIGWDLAVTPNGPVLLEPNWNWAVAPHYCCAGALDFSLSPVFARFLSHQR